jgi:YtkA-like
MRKLLAALAVSLLLPSAAEAGGFATVGLDPPPDGSRAWQVELTILQHGRTPLDGLDPKVIVERGSVRRAFAAEPAGQRGVYRAEVVFPAPGTWHYVVDDGFTATHTFPPVRVGDGDGDRSPVEAATSTGGGPDIPLALGVAAAVGLAVALAGAALRRARPAPG